MRSRITDMINELKQYSDYLKVEIHPVILEASQEWEVLEAKLKKVEHRGRELRGLTSETSVNVGVALLLLGQEIRHGLQEISRRIEE